MKLVLGRLLRTYTLLTILYPYGFRKEFSREMQAVFREKLVAKMAAGKWVLWRIFWEELRDWPGAVLMEYWFAFRETFGRGLMSLITEDKSWKIEHRRYVILASLPPVLFGICIALGALVVWEPWYTIPRWRLMTGFAIMMFPSLIIALGGSLALIKRLPAWGYTWAGGAVMGMVVFVKVLAEERADFGLPLLSPILDIVLIVLLLLGISALIVVTAWRGWRQAGLTSLGFATLAGMSSFSMATAAPFNRYDLALLAAPVGLIMSLLTYLYVRKGDAGRMISILGYGLMNAVVFLVIASAWNLPPERPSPVIAFLVVLTGALLIGPIAGLVGRPVRKVIQGS
ncbi:MAG: hypothetical protein JW963_20795 [Anaerolineales bacterium]|nr:hypothetical protein [Anaerolineales bacterium]